MLYTAAMTHEEAIEAGRAAVEEWDRGNGWPRGAPVTAEIVRALLRIDPARHEGKTPLPRESFEVWGTWLEPDQFSNGSPRVCLWGTLADAIEGADPDERVVRVRVEIVGEHDCVTTSK